ncbi:MAG: hypothetical protein ACK53Y_27820, partial [bacterium]
EFCRPPSTYVHVLRAGLLPSTRRQERLALRNPYQDILNHLDFTYMSKAGPLACSPSGGGLRRRTAERAGCCSLRWGSWVAYGQARRLLPPSSGSTLLGTSLGIL